MSRPKRIPLKIKQIESNKLSELLDDYFKKNPDETRVSIAKRWGISGGDAMVYHHKKGISPISMDAGIAYANGFGVPLSTISNRLAIESAKRVDASDGSELKIQSNDMEYTATEIEIVNAFRKLPKANQDAILTILNINVNAPARSKGYTPALKKA